MGPLYALVEHECRSIYIRGIGEEEMMMEKGIKELREELGCSEEVIRDFRQRNRYWSGSYLITVVPLSSEVVEDMKKCLSQS